jgi:hypothetical protein
VRQAVAATILSVAGSAAFADCPATPADVAAGISIVFDDGSVTRLSRAPDGTVLERTEYNDGAGSGFFSRSLFGFAYIEAADTLEGEAIPEARMSYDYGPAGLDLVDRPETEVTRYTLQRTVAFADGATVEERTTFRTRDYGEREWGGCSYRVLPVDVSNFDSDDGRALSFLYIPDLDVAVFIGVTEWDEPIAVAEPVSIARGLGSDG